MPESILPDTAPFECHAARERVAAPVCSVCIANYNGIALLDDCLQSVFAQDNGVAIEVIVHDDASSDGSVELVRVKYPQVEILASSANVGFCIANNRMVRHARGEYVLLLNNDAALSPGAVASLLEAAHRQQPAGILTLAQHDWETGALIDRGCLLDPFYNPVPNLDPQRHEVAMAIGACMFLKRSAWNELGGFPEWMDSIAEDLYVCCVARLRGLPVAVAPGSGYRHRGGSSFGGARVVGDKLHSTLRRRRLSERNKTYALIVCTPTAAVWPLLAAHMLLLFFEGSLLSVLRLDLRILTQVYLNVPYSVAIALRQLMACRRQIQRARHLTTIRYFSQFTWLPRKLAMLWRYGVPKVS